MSVLTVWGPHWKGLTDVPVVETNQLLEVRVRLSEAAHERAVMTVTGLVGSGKSFAVGRAAEAIADANPDLDIVWLELSRTTHEVRLLEEIYVSVMGVQPMKSAKARILTAELNEALDGRHRILVVDEGHNLARKALLELRGFHDRADANFALVIVGTPDLNDKLASEMRSRVSLRVHIDRLSDDAVVGVLHAFDKVFESIADTKLRHLNRARARGEFRWWAMFLLRARRYLAIAEDPYRIDDPTLEAVLASLP